MTTTIDDGAFVALNFRAEPLNDTKAGNANCALDKTHKVSFDAGSAANEANFPLGDDEGSLTSGEILDLDVFDLGSYDVGAGAGRDNLGQQVNLSSVVGLLIVNKSTSVGSLLVGGEGSAAAWNSIFNGDDDAKIVLAPGAGFAIVNPAVAGFAVADTSNHLLRLEASGGVVNYSIYLLGRRVA